MWRGLTCAALLLSLATLPACRQDEGHGGAGLPPIASACCYRAIDKEFNIDGVLDEESWKAAPKLLFAMSADPLGRLATYSGHLQAQWCWDDRYWYIAFSVASPDVNCPQGKKDWRSFSDDAVEVMIDPDGDALNYCGMEITPRQYVLDYLVKKAVAGEPIELDANWDCKGLRIGVQVDGTLDDRTDVDRGWTCEIAIPWTALASVPGGEKPHHGTQWRVNLLANDFLPPKGKQYIEFMWSAAYDVERPIYKFHVPKRFGKVTFMNQHLNKKKRSSTAEGE